MIKNQNALEIKRWVEKIINDHDGSEAYVKEIYVGNHEMNLIKNAENYNHAGGILLDEDGQYFIYDIPVYETSANFYLDAYIELRIEQPERYENYDRGTNGCNDYDYILPPNSAEPPNDFGTEYFLDLKERIERMQEELKKDASEKEIYCTCGTQLEVIIDRVHVQVEPCPHCLKEKSKECPFWNLKE